MESEIEEFKKYMLEEHGFDYQWSEVDSGEQKELFFKRTFYLCDKYNQAQFVSVFRFYKYEIERDFTFKKIKDFYYYINKEKRYTATLYPYIPGSPSHTDFSNSITPARK